MNTHITQQTRLSDLFDEARDIAQYKADYTGAPADFLFTPDGHLTTQPKQSGMFAVAPAPTALTRWAMQQACTKLGAAYGLPSLPAEYMDTLARHSPDLFADNMNAAIGRMPADKGWMVRTYKDTTRAVLSDQYLKLDNVDMLGMLDAAIGRDGSDHRLSSRSYVNPDNMVVDVLFKDIETGHGNGNGGFSIGVRIRNGEIGNWTGGVYPLVKRTSCDNSIAVDNRAMSFVFKHFGHKTAASKRVLLQATIGEVLPFSVQVVDALLAAEANQLPTFSDIVNGLAIKQGWTDAQTGAVFAGSEGRWSLAGLVNGVTYAAHTQTAKAEEMTGMEFLAGDLLFDNGRILRDAERAYANRTDRDAARAERAAARAAR